MQPVSLVSSGEKEGNRDFPHRTRPREDLLHSGIGIAVESHTGPQLRRHVLGIDAVGLSAVDTETMQLIPLVEEAQAITVGKNGCACHIEGVAPHFLHLAHIFAEGLRRVRRGDITGGSTEEIVREPAVERFLEIGRKGEAHPSQTAAAVFSGVAVHHPVQFLMIRRHHVFHIPHILQPSLYLEGNHTGLRHFIEMTDTAHVAERQPMAGFVYRAHVCIHQVKPQAAELGTLSPVGTA